MKKLPYFGCIRNKGHYLFDKDSSSINNSGDNLIPGLNVQVLKCIDGVFIPQNKKEGIYNESIVPPIRIVSWWDYSVDSRQGSNSNLIGYGYNSAEEMIDDAYKIFPSVMNRQLRPINA